MGLASGALSSIRLHWLLSRYWRSRHAASALRRLPPFRFTASGKPEVVTLEFTNICQSHCYYCTPQNVLPRVKGFMDGSTFSTVVRYLRPLHLRKLRIVGGGEPTLHPKVCDFIQACKSLAPIVTMVTNGQHLTEQVSAAIVSAVDFLEVSVGSNNAKEYERARPGASFRRLLANLDELARMRKAARSTLRHIRLRIMIRPSESSCITDLVRFWDARADSVTLQKVYSTSGDAFRVPPATGRFPRCTLPFDTLNIHWNGDIPLCSSSSVQSGRPDGLLLGNICREELLQTWHCELMNQYREGLRKRDPNLAPICRSCGGGC